MAKQLDEKPLVAKVYVKETKAADVTKEYVDQQDALTLQNANQYTDEQIPDVSNFVTDEELKEALDEKQDKGDYALKSEIPNIDNLATKNELNNGLNNKLDKNSLATINGQSLENGGNIEISGGETIDAYTKAESDERFQVKGDYALKSEIPDTSNLETKDEHKTDIDNLQSQIDNIQPTETKFQTGEELNTIGITEHQPNDTKVVTEQVANNWDQAILAAANQYTDEHSGSGESLWTEVDGKLVPIDNKGLSLNNSSGVERLRFNPETGVLEYYGSTNNWAQVATVNNISSNGIISALTYVRSGVISYRTQDEPTAPLHIPNKRYVDEHTNATWLYSLLEAGDGIEITLDEDANKVTIGAK